MTKEQAQMKYKEASGCFGQGAFEEAFVLLEEIDVGFPGRSEIAKAKSKCLAKLAPPLAKLAKLRECILQSLELLAASDTHEEVQAAFLKAAAMLSTVPGNEFRTVVEALRAWGDPNGPFGTSNELFDYCTRWIAENRERIRRIDAEIAMACRAGIERKPKGQHPAKSILVKPKATCESCGQTYPKGVSTRWEDNQFLCPSCGYSCCFNCGADMKTMKVICKKCGTHMEGA